MLIHRVSSLEDYDLNLLLEESLSEGHHFVKRLVDEYKSGANRFEENGEALYVALLDSKAIGIGGLNIDPYRNDINIGRVRHLYVSRKHRGHGTGRKLLNTIIDEAKK